MEQPAFDRVIGGTEEQREVFWDAIDADTKALTRENLHEVLSEMSEDEKRLLDQAIVYAHNISQQYGAIRTLDHEKVFILHKDLVYNMTHGHLRQGFYDIRTQSIFVDRTDSFAVTLSRVVHECLHMASFQAVKFYADGSDKIYRSGIQLTTVENGVQTDFFQVAQEAIIVNIISTTAFDGMAGSSGSIYTSSKYALRGLTNSVREEVKDIPITVIGVYPGGFQTDLFNEAKPENFDEFMSVESVAEKIVHNLELEHPETQLIIKRPGQKQSYESSIN